MRPVYINSAVSISAQDSLQPDVFDNLMPIAGGNTVYAQQPSYKDFIPPAQSRRMSKVVKMSTVAAAKALAEAGVENPDAIIVGTGMGCTEDSEKFLRNVIQNHEDYLTPTNFIQSTHNTVAGQIALGIGCHAYNFTYVNQGNALEFSVIDAKMQIETGEAETVLVGAADETAKRTEELYKLVNIIKKEDDLPLDFLNSETKGLLWGEGVSFFVLSAEKQESSYAELKDATIINTLNPNDLEAFVTDFLSKNNLESNDVDGMLLGYSGDEGADQFYKEFERILPNTAHLYFKHLSGDYNTASGFAYFLAANILKKQQVPNVLKINDLVEKKLENILIYNNFMGIDHGLTLLKKI